MTTKWSLTELTLFSFRERSLRIQIWTERDQTVSQPHAWMPRRLKWRACSISFEMCYQSPAKTSDLPPVDESLHTPEVIASLQTRAMKTD